MIKTLVLVVTAFINALTGCSPEQPPLSKANAGTQGAAVRKAEYRNIGPKEAKNMLDENDGAILLDVRTEAEFAEKHIEGAILISDYEIEEKAASLLPEKDALILVYCRSGNRSKSAAKKLVKMGYSNVYDFGGIGSWSYGTVS